MITIENSVQQISLMTPIFGGVVFVRVTIETEYISLDGDNGVPQEAAVEVPRRDPAFYEIPISDEDDIDDEDYEEKREALEEEEQDILDSYRYFKVTAPEIWPTPEERW